MLMIGETILEKNKLSWRNYWPALAGWGMLSLLAAAAVYAVLFLGIKLAVWLAAVWSLTALLPFLLLVLPFYYLQVCSNCYTITSQRIIARQGLLEKHIQEVRIVDIRSVNMHQSFWQRIFHIGDIFIGTAGTAEVEISMRGVGHPEAIVELINSKRIA
ncbi:PH domain-containing protein [Victivallis sp. Marseille-Q1083]|uniref:PH domain-containing protein n=1 Tax=Victivallis sp. Marseille-Q1083 TaxID=2717288 RepID=UPI00158ED931|nr:PH domain-containing protein [Victivallis sp. Marseille-Q1083]